MCQLEVVFRGLPSSGPSRSSQVISKDIYTRPAKNETHTITPVFVGGKVCRAGAQRPISGRLGFEC